MGQLEDVTQAVLWLASDEAWDRLVRVFHKDLNVKVRVRAVRGLARTGRPEARKLIEEAKDGDRQGSVRKAAAAALEAWADAEPAPDAPTAE